MSLLISCQSNSEDHSADVIDIEEIKKEIQAKENEFAEIYNGGERKKIGYYADDAITYLQNNPPIIGKRAIIDYLMANIDSLSIGNQISFVTDEVFPSSDGNQVVEIGYYKVIDSDENILNTGYYMTLFEKRDGSYVSLREMSASDMILD
jgi:hypothetical protein